MITETKMIIVTAFFWLLTLSTGKNRSLKNVLTFKTQVSKHVSVSYMKKI